MIWFGFFSYSLSVALLFQMLLPLLLPSLHAGGGLLSQDAVYFHQSAIVLAEEIRLNGWGAWRVWPSPTTTGNVAILGAIYAIFGYKPILLLPLNAALHASSGLCLILIGRKLFLGTFSKVGAFIAGCLYIIFPSSINWYAQNHKDEYAALGFLLLILAGVRLLKAKKFEGANISLFMAMCGLLLTALVRPQNLQLFTTLGAGILVIGVICTFKHSIKFIPLLTYAFLILLSSIVIKVSPIQAELSPQTTTSDFAQFWEWNATPEVPKVLDNTFKKVANIRVFMAASAIRDGSGSLIDRNFMPSDFYGVLQYLPAAGLNGLFAPYPNTWAEKRGPLWKVGVIEIMVWYLLLPGMLWLMWKNKTNMALWWVAITTYVILNAESFLIPNLGTLHRIRYPFIFIFILLGSIGWCNFLTLAMPKFFLKDQSSDLELALPLMQAKNNVKLSSIFKSIPLIFATFILFFGLFFRDIFFTHVFGFGSVLDEFQNAANLPLTALALLAVPLTPALIAHFEGLRSSSPSMAREWVQAMAGKLLLWFSTLGILIVLIQLIGFLDHYLESSAFLGIWFFPVVVLSGITVLGNAILICNKQATLATFFQLSVPIAGICFAYFFGESRLGVLAPMLGLVLGQMINLAMVSYFCYGSGFSLSPRLTTVNWDQWGRTYMPLVASAAIVGISVPIAIYFSTKMQVGSTAILYIGGKFFQSITVFIGAIFLSIALPYFIKLVRNNHEQYSHGVFSKILNIGIFIGSLASILVCIFIPDITHFIFLSKNIRLDQLESLNLTIQIGILQLPFFIASLTLIKYMVALDKAFIIFYATVIGQVINVCASLVVLHLGLSVELLSMSAALGLACSSGVLIFWAKAKKILLLQDLYWMFALLPTFIAMAVGVLLSNHLALFFSLFLFITAPLFISLVNSRVHDFKLI
jgi:peptidoglycan biosynthesis protein MviN/MurJ (putative lipid II flippase)